MHEEGEKTLNNLTSLLALKPRQILLAEQQHRPQLINQCGPKMMNKQPLQVSNCCTEKSELKPAVLKSILSYLHKNGFSKTLKHFLKEAGIESDDWKTTSVDLEDVYSKYAVHCQNSDVKIKGSVHEDVILEKDMSDFCTTDETSKKKKKKDKKIKEKSKNDVPAISESIEHSKSEDLDKNTLKDKETGTKGKSKEKKRKNRSDSVSQTNDTEITEEKLASSVIANGHDKINEGAGKAKEKKKKKVSELPDNVKSLESKDKKVSKKRKSSASNDGEEVPVEGIGNGESKRRKIDEVKDNHTEINEDKEAIIKEDKLKNEVQQSSEPKSQRKERNVYSEPRTVNAFQRVKVDEVIIDDRLQNNSYWAKDGAEYGYGAKAQEVLGQVKGKGFRHEKTKKKRGSYRGGQIDFEAHSIKFNYSEEE